MNGFFFDENLPAKILLTPSLPIIHVSVLGRSPSDTEIWQYAKDKKLVIVTKDADFSERLMLGRTVCFSRVRAGYAQSV